MFGGQAKMIFEGSFVFVFIAQFGPRLAQGRIFLKVKMATKPRNRLKRRSHFIEEQC
jgi:hypothetical protein